MWKVIDDIVGEFSTHDSYADAYEMTERRIGIHTQDYKGRGDSYHKAIKCKALEDKKEKTITIKRM